MTEDELRADIQQLRKALGVATSEIRKMTEQLTVFNQILLQVKQVEGAGAMVGMLVRGLGKMIRNAQ